MNNQSVRQSVRKDSSSQAGFSMIEMMIVASVMLVIATMGYPALNQWIHRERLMGYVNQVQIHMAMARQEAIRRGVPVVVQPRPDMRGIRVHANVDGLGTLGYDPVDGAVHRTADYEVGFVTLPAATNVQFGGPGGSGSGPSAPSTRDGSRTAPGGGNGGGNNNVDYSAPVDGLTPMPEQLNAVVFMPDGSVLNPGAIRINSDRGHFLELAVGPVATARVAVRKYNAAPAWGGDPGFYERGHDPVTGQPLWKW